MELRWGFTRVDRDPPRFPWSSAGNVAQTAGHKSVMQFKDPLGVLAATYRWNMPMRFLLGKILASWCVRVCDKLPLQHTPELWEQMAYQSQLPQLLS